MAHLLDGALNPAIYGLHSSMQQATTTLLAAATAAPTTTTTTTMPATTTTTGAELVAPVNFSPATITPSTTTSTTNSGTSRHTEDEAKTRMEMYGRFQSWASQNYGETGKTKTVTRRKYDRIVRILSGLEPSNSENSKFRFWVKAKGFRLGPPPVDDPNIADQVLYVPTKTAAGDVTGEKEYKRVAKVEDFFDIIYNVHVEMDGRGGKHAGQKRTYRAVSETYSFLPREAVTRFLMSCSDCQKRMHLTMETNNNNHRHANVSHVTDDPPIIDFSLPITTTYLNHLKSKKCVEEHPSGRGRYLDEAFPYQHRDEDSMSETSSVSQAASSDKAPSPFPAPITDSSTNSSSISSGISSGRPIVSPVITSPATETTNKEVIKQPAVGGATATSRGPSPVSYPASDVKQEEPRAMAERNGSLLAAELGDKVSVTAVKKEDRSPAVENRKRRASNDSLDVKTPERKRRASNDSLDSSTKASECTADDVRDDDDDNDDDEEDKLMAKDPEKLKAFNMFVRLFVDENLDRSVPISKQPKDKIQAILEACDRQFPDFHERARKRVRTYLKSCRRMRRSKDGNGWDQLRPTPPHLTSAAAEALLALACENESNNAKRMRMGLEPLPASAMLTSSSNSTSNGVVTSASTPQSQHSPSQPTGASSQPTTNNATLGSSSPSPTPAHAHAQAHGPFSAQTQPPPPPPPSTDRATPSSGATGESYLRSQGSSQPTAFRPPHELSSPFFAGTNGLFRPGFPSSYQHPAHHHSPVLQHTSILQNGPTDLSMKKSTNTSPTKNQLNPSEVATIKQLIAGYRESAAFLYRSADELEQLLLQQN